MTTARILITGASGFIGGFITEEALRRGFETTVVVRRGSDRSRLADPRIQFMEVDWKDDADLLQKLTVAGRFNYVVHNAGVVKAAKAQTFFDVNAELTRRFAVLLNTHDLMPEKFLYVSSLAAMGPADSDGFVSRSQTPNPLTSYGASKLAAERHLEKMTDFPWTVLQPTVVYGPAERELFTFIQLMNRRLEFHVGTRPQRLNFIYAADLVDAMFAALVSPESSHKKYLVADGHNYTSNDLAKAVGQALGKRPFAAIRVPFALVDRIAGVLEKIADRRGRPTVLSKEKMREMKAENWTCDITPLRTELRFTPQVDLYEGMRRAVEWYRENKWL